jgi:eukaryotic-like serine/threonine-protein kinase
MPLERVLLISLTPDEQKHLERLLPQLDHDALPQFYSTVAEAVEALAHGNVRLVVLRICQDRPRPDQDIRRIKKSVGAAASIFLLVPQEQASRVSAFVRAGADDFWLLPLDDVAFPARFQVVFEWGRAMMRPEAQPPQAKPRAQVSIKTLGRHLLERIHGLFGSSTPHMGAATRGEHSTLIAGKWEKIRRLGFGSFGEVWLVRSAVGNTVDNLAVAKIPHDGKMNTKCLREATILRRLAGHENAVQLYEIVKESGLVVLIQEYVEGQSLQVHFEQGMDGPTKEQAFLQLVAVMAFAHQQKIMHRDIKPENIILMPEGRLKLLDFGTAKDLTRRSVSNTVIGSRPYMAPEQILGKSRLASDVWALGVILYALATDCLPFFDENEKQLMDMILEVEPERPSQLEPDLPGALEDIILRCLQKDLTMRYPDATALREHLMTVFPAFGRGGVLPPYPDEPQ